MRYFVINIKVLVTVYSLLAIVCIFSNGLVCYTILKRKVPNGALKYIFSLAITDIFVGAVCNPLHQWMVWILFYKQISQFNQIMTLRFALLTSGVLLPTSSILHLCLMALDRMMAVSKPIYHPQKL